MILQVALGFNYLKNNMAMRFPEVRARAAAAEAEQQERQVHHGPFLYYNTSRPRQDKSHEGLGVSTQLTSYDNDAMIWQIKQMVRKFAADALMKSGSSCRT